MSLDGSTVHHEEEYPVEEGALSSSSLVELSSIEATALVSELAFLAPECAVVTSSPKQQGEHKPIFQKGERREQCSANKTKRESLGHVVPRALAACV